MNTLAGETQSILSNAVVLQSCTESGDGILIGVNTLGTHLVQMYWLADCSQNTIFEYDERRVWTNSAGRDRPLDPRYRSYLIMREGAVSSRLVSNDPQAQLTASRLHNNPMSLRKALKDIHLSSDSAFCKPLLFGYCQYPEPRPTIELALLRQTPRTRQEERIHHTHQCVEPGYGYCITSYPSLVNKSLLLPLCGSVENILNAYWDLLNEENRVALAVKMINRRTGVSEIRVKNK